MEGPLERLAELVKQAEARSRAQKLVGLMRQAAERFRQAERGARAIDRRLSAMRPKRLRELEEAQRSEQQLKELVRKTAQLKSFIEADSDVNIEELIDAARAEIESKRRVANKDLEAMAAEAEQAQKKLQEAMDEYRQLRREMDRLRPELAPEFAEEDRLLIDAEMLLPGGQLQALRSEIEESIPQFGQWDQKEQYARLKIWIGRLRRLQSTERSDDDQELGRRIFSMLVDISKQYQPGYIEAFQHTYTTDWDTFIAEAQEQLRQATASRLRKAGAEPAGSEQGAETAASGAPAPAAESS